MQFTFAGQPRDRFPQRSKPKVELAGFFFCHEIKFVTPKLQRNEIMGVRIPNCTDKQFEIGAQETT